MLSLFFNRYLTICSIISHILFLYHYLYKGERDDINNFIYQIFQCIYFNVYHENNDTLIFMQDSNFFRFLIWKRKKIIPPIILLGSTLSVSICFRYCELSKISERILSPYEPFRSFPCLTLSAKLSKKKKLRKEYFQTIFFLSRILSFKVK